MTAHTVDSILAETKKRMKTSIETLRREMATVRTGRANPSILDSIHVEYYGSEMPLTQLASVSVPESSTLVIQPFDKSSIKAIETAILKSELGLNPANDGNVIRLPIPALTEERRKELTKVVHRMGEEIKTAIRNVRRDANDDVKKLEKDKNAGVSEDAAKKTLDQIQKLTDDFIKEIDETVKHKDAEILKV
ncbi:ribosome recycling factor [Holophaga foetida]|uniref:ribosome recycling factor n=1 Tax=Holophaga foetida TaxID=35839 RepID=UPI0002472103|nr:ribosome recycling factor [Holophaga foetida]